MKSYRERALEETNPELPQYVLRIVGTVSGVQMTESGDHYYCGPAHSYLGTSTRYINAARYVSKEVAELAAKQISEEFFEYFKGIENGKFVVGIYAPDPIIRGEY